MKVLKEKIKKIYNLEKYIEAYDQVEEHIFRGLAQAERSNSTNFERLHMRHGVLRSTSNLSLEDKFDANQFFQYRDKAEVALLERKVGQLTIENDFLKKSWTGYVKRTGKK